MKIGSRHGAEREGRLTSFLGGLDRSLPPFAIAEEALIDATNFYYDPATGYLTTRPGIKKYTSSALPNGAQVFGVTEFISGATVYVVVASDDQNLYYLDGAFAPVLIGALTGSERPSFTQMGGKLVICSGGALQTWDGVTLTTTASPSLTFISEHARKDVARIVGCGNNVNLDRVNLSGSNDPENWAGATEADAKYFDAGYLDGLTVGGIGVYRGDVFVFKKTPGNTAKKLFRAVVNDVSSNWSCKELSKHHSVLSPHLLREVNGEVIFFDKEGPKILSAVEGFSEFPFDVTPAGKTISGEIRKFLQEDGFTIYDPVFGVLMCKPSRNSDTFYVLDALNGRWTYFRYALNIQSGAYVNGKMLLGASNGYVYEYDTSLDQDDGASYIMSAESKWFEHFPMYKEMIKEKELDVVGLKDGSITFAIKNKGTQVHSAVLAFSQTWLDWTTVNALTIANWTEALTKNVFATLRDFQRVDGDQVSFQITVTSGLCSLAQLRVRAAATGRS